MQHGKAVKHPRPRKPKKRPTPKPSDPKLAREWHPMRPPYKLEDPVPNWRLRKWYLQHAMWADLNLARVAEDVGWLRGNNGRTTGDESRVLRALGLRTTAPTVKKGVRYDGSRRRWIEREDAVKLARAMGADPVDVGL